MKFVKKNIYIYIFFFFLSVIKLNVSNQNKNYGQFFKSWNLYNLTAIYWKFKKQITFLCPYEILLFLFFYQILFFLLIFLNSILMVK